MKKKKKVSLKLMSVLLTLCLMLSVVFSAPIVVTAAAVGERNDITVSDVAVSKVESIDGNEEVKRTPVRRLYEEEGDDLNKTVWLNDDGTRTMTVYDYPVKFVNADGQIQDISLDVAEAADGSGAFKTAAGWVDTVFPSKITDGVTLSANGEALRLTPVMPQGSLVASAERSNKLVAKDNVARKDTKTVSYNYDSKTNIEYSLTYNGFKEDIVVNEYTGQTEYSFFLETNGLTLVNNNGSYHLEDAEGNVKASVGDVIIFTADERNNTMGYMTHTTVKENHSYFINIHIDADWLKDEKTVYPIRIDPTLEMTSTQKVVEDVTIYSGGASNPTSAVLYVGKRKDELGVARVLMKFPNLDLSAIANSKRIVSAGVRIRDLMCEAEQMGVYCYIYDGNNWEDNTATWGNNSIGYTHFLSHNDVSYDIGVKKDIKHSYYFSITDAVKYWLLTDEERAARPDNYDMEKGLMFKAKNDTTMDKIYKSFGSYNRSNYRPTIEITYKEYSNTISKPFGWFDKVTDTEISGWAWCFDYPNTSLICAANMYNETNGITYTLTGTANISRTDVAAAGYGTGNYGFSIPIDWNHFPAGKYRIEVEAWDVNNHSGYILPQSPRYYTNDLMYTPITAANFVQGNFSHTNSVDIYCFIPTVTDYYTIKTLGMQDTRGTLSSVDDSIDSDDDSGPNNNFQIDQFLYAGVTYFIKVISKEINQTGSYDLVVYNRKNILNKIGELHQLATQYTSNTETAAVLTFQFIRRMNSGYLSDSWGQVAGVIDENFVAYVCSNNVSVYKFFSADTPNFVLYDPSGGVIDLPHLAATMNALLVETSGAEALLVGELHIDRLAGWAGDLQTLMKDVLNKAEDPHDYEILYDSTIEMMGDENYSFGMMDLLADVDAINLYKSLNMGDIQLSFEVYYDFYNELGYQARFTRFISGKNYAEFYDIVRIYTDQYYLFPVEWPLLQEVILTESQSNAFASAFTSYIWRRLQDENTNTGAQ